MKKYFTILFLLFVSAAVLYSQQPYTNDDFGFRMNFPDGWNIKTGVSETIVVSASGGENIEINVGLQGSGTLGDSALLKMGLEKFVSSMEDHFRTSYQGYKTLESGQTKIDSVNAFYMTYSISDEKASMMRGLQYFIVYNNRMYIITAGSPDSFYNAYSEAFKNSIDSFKFIRQ